jgi:hypothetical protein
MGHGYNLAVDSARACQDVPMLQARSPAQARIQGRSAASMHKLLKVHFAAPQAAVFRQQVYDLLAATFAPARKF